MKKRFFGTDGVRGAVGKDPMSADFALRLASAAAQVLVPTGGGAIPAANIVSSREKAVPARKAINRNTMMKTSLKTRPILAPAIRFSPQVRFSKDVLSLMASSGPILRLTSIGTAR